MAALQLTPSTLAVRLSRGEKIAGLLRDHEFPLSAVRSAEVVSDPIATLRGLRAPGLGLPGVRKIGTWRRSGEKLLVSVRRDQPAVRVELTGQTFQVLLVGLDDAAAVAARLTAVVDGGARDA